MQQSHPDLKDHYNKRPVDYAEHNSKVGQLFGAVDRDTVLLYSGGIVIFRFLVSAAHLRLQLEISEKQIKSGLPFLQ
ncbi:hypothetical protein [Wolbachia endosymbiont (group A) of Urophora cardui]|uniref:hypothetical protein n=1 Tax=Wolbachia endosymbiont (group A) of Urophora cardui TaxID=3066156 RepID=UPI00333FB3D8